MSKIKDDLERYRYMWLDKVSELGQLKCRMENMREVIIELYYSSFWDSDRLQPDTAEYIWTKVKETFELDESGPKRVHINDPKEGD